MNENSNNSPKGKRIESMLDNKRKEKLSSLRDFKIHSNGLSPNTSLIRGKNILKEAYLEQTFHSNSNAIAQNRKEIYQNHLHFKKNPQGTNENSYNVGERHSYNYTDMNNRKQRQSSEHNYQRHKTPNSSNFQQRISKNFTDVGNQNNNKTNVSSNVKQKIKNLLNGGVNINNLMQNVNTTNITNEESTMQSEKRKTAKLITTNTSDASKKLHKKSNSMKNDLLQKYYGKYGDTNLSQNNQTMNDGVMNKNQSGIQRLSRSKDNNVSDMGHKHVDLSGQNFNSKGHMKTQSMMDKNPAFQNNCEARKNLNDKIMKKYKHSNLIKNPSETAYPKPDQPKTSILYDKFLATNKIKKNTPDSDKKQEVSDISLIKSTHGEYHSKNVYDHGRVISSSTGEQKNTYQQNAAHDNHANSKDLAHSNSFPVKSFLEPLNISKNVKNTPYMSSQKSTTSSHKKTESLNLKYSQAKKPPKEEEQTRHSIGATNVMQREAINQSNVTNSKLSKGETDRKGKKIRSAKASISTNVPTGEVTRKSYTLSNNFELNQEKSMIQKTYKTKSAKVYKQLDEIKARDRELPYFEKAKVIIKEFGAVKAFSVNTHQGTVRNYNEDRVSILLNAQQRFENLQSKNINQCSMFGVYDGHGGADCCNFLKENLHNYLLTKYKETNIEDVIIKSFKEIDLDFLKRAQKDFYVDTSGSCAQVLLVVDDKILFINTGDSRGMISKKKGREIIQTTNDHKPHTQLEYSRIFPRQGQLYRVSSNKYSHDTEISHALNYKEFAHLDHIQNQQNDRIFGPWRVKPGGLSVSRTFGDIESKLSTLGGIDGVVVPDPEVHTFDIDSDLDYALIACDGIFDVLTNEQVNDVVWETVGYYKENQNTINDAYTKCLCDCVNNILKKSLLTNSEDNVTVILVAFRDLFSC